MINHELQVLLTENCRSDISVLKLSISPLADFSQSDEHVLSHRDSQTTNLLLAAGRHALACDSENVSGM